MKIVFTGSSLLEVYKGEADLSRRAITYHLYGLSFREFLEYEHGIKLEVSSLDDIMLKLVVKTRRKNKSLE